MNTSTLFLITFVVRPNRIPDFETMLATVKSDLPMTDGCQGVQIYCHEDAAQNTFTLLETWDDKAKHQAHVAGLQASGDWALIEQMLLTPPNGAYMLTI